MKIAVLFGGTSSERDVSIASGIQVINALRKAGHQVIAVDSATGILSESDEQQLLNTSIGLAPPVNNHLSSLQAQYPAIMTAPEFVDIDVVFIALHGGDGEDGTIQAALDLSDLVYTGSGHLASAIAMDKDISKRLFRAAGIPTADWIMAPVSPAYIDTGPGYPVVVKPNNQGSSVGLTIVRSANDLDSAIDKAMQYGAEVIIEKYIKGRELTVGILGNQALEVGEIIPLNSDVFDYESKYQKGGADEIFPAAVAEDIRQKVRELALQAHKVLKLDGFSRVDFRLDENGNLWCLEANTVPGLTAYSLLPKSAQAAGIDFTGLCDRICRLALTRHNKSVR